MKDIPVLSRCTKPDYDSPTTRCNGVLYVDGSTEGGCGDACRFRCLKRGEGYPPLPNKEVTELLHHYYTLMRFCGIGEGTVDDAMDGIYRWFEHESGYKRPSKEDDKYSQELRQRAFEGWHRRKLRAAEKAFREYVPTEAELSVPQALPRIA